MSRALRTWALLALVAAPARAAHAAHTPSFLVPPARAAFNPYYIVGPENPWEERFDGPRRQDRGLRPWVDKAEAELSRLDQAGEADSLDAAYLCDYLVSLHARLGHYGDPRMLELSRRAVRIKRRVLGERHAEVDYSSMWLAHVSVQRGEYATAREIYTGLVDRPDDPRPHEREKCLLAEVLIRQGDYEGARRVLDSIGPAVRWPLEAVSGVLTALGDDAAARIRLEAALAKAPAAQQFRRAPVLTNLAVVLAAQGELERAEAVAREAIAAEGQYHAAHHPRMLLATYNLATILHKRGKLEEARIAYRDLSAIEEQSLGRNYPEHLLTELGLANVLVALGKFDEARPLHELLLDASAGHPHRPSMLAGAAWGRWAEGRRAEAVRLALEAESAARAHFRTMVSAISEREALRYDAIRVRGLDMALTYLRGGGRGVPVEAVWTELANSRGLILDQLAWRNRFVLDRSDPVVRRGLVELADARNELARVAYTALAREGASPRAELLDARAHKERLERELAYVGRRLGEPARDTSLASIRAALPPAAALVGYAVHEDLDAGTPAYMAFVLSPKGIAIATPLGPAAPIDAAIARFRELVAADPRAAPDGATRAEARYQERARELRRLLWDPLAPQLTGARTVLVVPDGQIHRVAFAALVNENGRYLLEDGPMLHSVSAERDLVSYARPGAGAGLLLVGNPAFDAVTVAEGGSPLPLASTTAAATPIPEVEPEVLYRGSRPQCVGALSFASLGETQREVEAIRELWARGARPHERDRLRVLTGAGAGERAFKQLAAGHRVLHLATHGFFLEQCGSWLEAQEPSSGRPGENPLLLAGLALAGAGMPPEGVDREDGILTAEEIASVDLRDVEWVVLSGCETGLGQIRAGEGVLGLRRAFQVAGARSTIMSLWRVGDESTRPWMEALYRARLAGKSTAEAVRAASLERVQALRARKASVHPFSWAAFVAAGDWR